MIITTRPHAQKHTHIRLPLPGCGTLCTQRCIGTITDCFIKKCLKTSLQMFLLQIPCGAHIVRHFIHYNRSFYSLTTQTVRSQMHCICINNDLYERNKHYLHHSYCWVNLRRQWNMNLVFVSVNAEQKQTKGTTFFNE